MKKLTSFLLAACLLLTLLPAHAAQALVRVEFCDEATLLCSPVYAPQVGLLFNGQPLESDVPALLAGGRTLAPVRALGEALGAEVTWRNDARQAVLRKGDTTIVLTLGSAKAAVNGVETDLPDGIPAVMVGYQGQTRTFAPLRFVAEQLGASVEWDGGTFTAAVSTASGLAGHTAPKAPGRFTVAIDPGHGGIYSGAAYEGIQEKTVNQAVARLLRAELESLGYRVVMTMDADETVGLYERCDIANAAGADIFISLHSNASVTSSTFQGIFTYYYPGSSRGAALAQSIQTPVCKATGAVDRGILSENFVVVRETAMPAVLVEMGFMSTHEELMRLIDPAYQAKLAWGVAEGAVRYLNTLSK